MDVLELEATTAEMAEMLGVHARTLQVLEKDGWIAGKVGRNRWNVARTVQYYSNHRMLERIFQRSGL